MMGLINVEKGQPAFPLKRVFPKEFVLENSSFVFESMNVCKQVVGPTLAIEKVRPSAESGIGSALVTFGEAELSQRIQHHSSMPQALYAYENLHKEFSALSNSHNIYHSTTGYTTAGGRRKLFRLDSQTRINRRPHEWSQLADSSSTRSDCSPSYNVGWNSWESTPMLKHCWTIITASEEETNKTKTKKINRWMLRGEHHKIRINLFSPMDLYVNTGEHCLQVGFPMDSMGVIWLSERKKMVHTSF